MLKDFKSEWNAIWTISDTLKCGVTIKDAKTSISEQIKLLKVQVTDYQQLVSSCCTIKTSETPLALFEKIEETLVSVEAIKEVVIVLIALQAEANNDAPKGALMLPENYPSTLYNPTLEKLSTEIITVLAAMNANILASGLNTEIEAEEGDMSGATVKSNVTATNFTPPSWFKNT